jgi:hypothetical protein
MDESKTPETIRLGPCLNCGHTAADHRIDSERMGPKDPTDSATRFRCVGHMADGRWVDTDCDCLDFVGSDLPVPPDTQELEQRLTTERIARKDFEAEYRRAESALDTALDEVAKVTDERQGYQDRAINAKSALSAARQEIKRLRGEVDSLEGSRNGHASLAVRAERERDEALARADMLPSERFGKWDGPEEAIHLFHREREAHAASRDREGRLREAIETALRTLDTMGLEGGEVCRGLRAALSDPAEETTKGDDDER